MRSFLAFLCGGVGVGLVAVMLGNRSGFLAALRRLAGLSSPGRDDGSIAARLDRARREAKEVGNAVSASRENIASARSDVARLADLLQSIQDANDDSANPIRRRGDSID